MNSYFYDIESAPVPDAELAQYMPEFKAPGNYRDEAKIAAAIEKARTEWIEDAALRPFTGRVIAIGFRYRDKTFIKDGDDERELLNWIWSEIGSGTNSLHWVGFGTHAFDLPMLLRRSWHHGIAPPHWIRRGRYFDDRFIDLREVWCMGDRYAEGSLDTVSRFLGLAGKTGTGLEFAKLYATDKDKARAYLENDLILIEQLHGIMNHPI